MTTIPEEGARPRHTLLTVREVADTMRVSTMTVYRLIRSEALSATQIGKHFRIKESDLEDYLARGSTTPRDSSI